MVEAEVFSPVLRKSGFKYLDSGVKLHWGRPEVPELVVTDMLMAYEKGAVNLDEIRNMLVKSGWELTLNKGQKK